MLRQPPTHESEAEQTQIKMQMLESNIIRVISQNKKLQHLLQYRDYFPKLKEYSVHVSSNWDRLNTLINSINDLDVQIKTERENIHSNVNHYYEYINKNIVQQFKEYKSTIDNHQQRITEIKSRQKLTIKKNFEKMKAKWTNHIKFAESQVMDVLIKTQNSFVEAINRDVVPRLAQKIQKQFIINESNCRTQLGHVQNLLSYYSALSQNKKEAKSQRNESLESDLESLQEKTHEIMGINVDAMDLAIKQMEGKLKGVSGEVAWLQNKRRKMKRVATKQSEQSHSNHEDFAQNPKLVELRYQADEVQCQLIGLSKYCDEVMLEKKMLAYVLKQKSKGLDAALLSENQERKMLYLRQKIMEVRSKITQYDQFYKSFNI